MRELDTESPVVWPAWCYTGEVSSESTSAHNVASVVGSISGRSLSIETGALNQTSEVELSLAAASRFVSTTAPTASSPQAPIVAPNTHPHLSSAVTPRPPRGRKRHTNHNGIDAPPVKTERLTPDNSSRCVTPLSTGHPGTPPSATSLTVPESATTAGQHHLKHVEQIMMGRSYTEFMRSLAAKYNNSNPSDSYLSTPRNGYSAGLDARFSSFKAAAATPYVGLMAPLGATGPQVPAQQATTAKEAKEAKHQSSTESSSVANSIFGSPTNLFPPMLDMSSTQALLHMVRTANAAQNAAELESYLKGANKRETSLSSPLDLSNSAFSHRKRARPTTEGVRRPESVSPKPSKLLVLGNSSTTPISLSPTANIPVALTAQQITSPRSNCGQQSISGASTTPRQGSSPPPIRCPSFCGHVPCGDGQTVSRWSVDDVANYVASIDTCAEYAQNFREHRIDGASLPLLSEEHLTGPMGMKLGPALKLRALLSRKLGACIVCSHCAHCHQSPIISPTINSTVQHQHQQHPQQPPQQQPPQQPQQQQQQQQSQLQGGRRPSGN